MQYNFDHRLHEYFIKKFSQIFLILESLKDARHYNEINVFHFSEIIKCERPALRTTESSFFKFLFQKPPEIFKNNEKTKRYILTPEINSCT